MPQLNPTLCRDVLSGELFPLQIPGEIFALRRSNIYFEGQIPGFRKLKASGMFFLTSHRIVFLAETGKSHADFSSIEITFRDMRQVPDFEQPIFGANFLKIDCSDGTAATLSFMSGGCHAFLAVFFKLFDDAPRNPEIVNRVLQQRALNVAYVDPNDPSVFFVSQPRPAE